MTTRITYNKMTDGTMVSRLNYLTQTGARVRVVLNNNTYAVENIESGEVVAKGESEHPTYLKLLAKKALITLVGEQHFGKEVRKRIAKDSGVSYEQITE